MSNTNKHLLFAVFLITVVLLYRYIFIDGRPQQAAVNSEALIASIQESIAPYQQRLDSSLAVIVDLTETTAYLQDSLGKINAAIRRQPQRLVEVPVIQVAECDSAKIVGQQFSRENQALRNALADCQELTAVQDTAIQDLGAELIAAERRHHEDQKELLGTQKDLEKETDRKKTWRSTTFMLLFKTVVDELRMAMQ